jgi:hypothetical protein
VFSDTLAAEGCAQETGDPHMIKFLLWLILFILCWPLALLALLLWPIVWLISIPFRLIGITLQGVFELLKAIVLLPARLLGGGPAARA